MEGNNGNSGIFGYSIRCTDGTPNGAITSNLAPLIDLQRETKLLRSHLDLDSS